LDSVLKYFKNIYKNLMMNNLNLVDSYSNTANEIESVKYGVGIYNRSESALLHLKGKDVLDFLQRISTNDVLKVEPNHYVPTLFTNEKGRLIDRAILIRHEDEYFLVGSKKNDTILERWISKYIITEDVSITNKTSSYLILDIIGPQAESYLTLICGKQVEDLDNNKLHKIDIDNREAFLLKKTTSTNQNLYWVISELVNANELFDHLLSHKSVFDLSMIGEKAFDFYRIINGVPKFPNEINDNYNPHETELLTEVSFTKGCFIGQEVIARLDTYDKVQKKLKKVKLEGIQNISTPIELFEKDKNLVGTLTTLIKAAENNHYEGLAFIRKDYIDSDEIIVEVTSTGEKVKMKVLN